MENLNIETISQIFVSNDDTVNSNDGDNESRRDLKDKLSTDSESMPLSLYSTDNLANIALSYNILEHNKRKIGPEDFVLLHVIGKGSYGKVMMVQYKYDGCIYAMKMLRKENIINKRQIVNTKTERYILEMINHPFIVHLYFAFQTARKLYCPGGELFYHISGAGRISEMDAIFYAAEILLALEHLHKLDIVYRDLKPENVLLDKEGHIRLTDFGLSKLGVKDNYSAKSLCGTPEYMAPEILNRTGHGKAVDWWNFGALIYEMLTGLPPFYTHDRERLYNNIRYGQLHYPSYISQNAKSLLLGLFEKDPNKRFGGGPEDASAIKVVFFIHVCTLLQQNHPIFKNIDWIKIYKKEINPPFRPLLSSKTDPRYFDKEFLSLPVRNSDLVDPQQGIEFKLLHCHGFRFRACRNRRKAARRFFSRF